MPTPVQNSGPRPASIPEPSHVESKDSKQTNTSTSIPSETPPSATTGSNGAEMKADHAMRGEQIATNLERKISPSAPSLEHIEKGGAVARKGQTGESVADIQRALNRDGANPPLDANGKFDANTETAVREYQKKNGLLQDGRVGPETMKHILPSGDSVEKDPRFAKLDPGVRKEIADRMKSSPKDYEARAGLKEVATQPGFEKLGPTQQREMLGILDKAPQDKALADDLRKMAGSENFQKLDPSIQSHGLKQLDNHATDPKARETLIKLQTTNGFQKLEKKEQERLLTMVGGKNEIISKSAREGKDGIDGLEQKMKSWSTTGNADEQAKELRSFLKDQNFKEWETWPGAWNGRTTPPDSIRGPETLPPWKTKFDTDPTVQADKYVLTYGSKEIPVYVPKGQKPDQITETLGALSKPERDLIKEVKVEPKGDGKDSLFDANGDTGVIRAFPEGLAMKPPERQKSAMVHESAHLIDRRLGKSDPNWDANWNKAMKDDVLTVSQRAKHGLPESSAEDFAESYLTYRLVKDDKAKADEFKAMYPNRWKYLEEIDKKANNGTL